MKNTRILKFSADLFVQMFQGEDQKFKITENSALPKDAKIIDVQFTGDGMIDFVIESSTFNEKQPLLLDLIATKIQ